MPNIGAIFALYVCCPSGAPPFDAFVAAYVDESFTRNVLWWRRNCVAFESQAVFDATRVARDIAMFLSIFVNHVVGPDKAAFAAAVDAPPPPSITVNSSGRARLAQHYYMTAQCRICLCGCHG